MDGNNLSFDEIVKIKLKGKMYFKYNDKVIAKRNFKNKVIISSFMMGLSLIGIVLSFLVESYYSTFFAMPFLYSLYLIGAAFTQKDKIKCKSFFSPERKYNRLSTNGDIVNETKINVIRYVFNIFIILYVIFVIPFIVSIVQDVKVNLVLKSILAIVMLLDTTICFLYYYLISCKEHISIYYGRYLYYYKNKFYDFN